MIAEQPQWEQIKAALQQYAWGYDHADFDLLADAFCADAVSGGKITGTDISWGPMRGRDEIVAGMRAMRAGQAQIRHCLSNMMPGELGQNSADLLCYLTLLHTREGKTGLASSGTIAVEARKYAGRWRLARLDVTLDAAF